jgi:hypothetical protein
MLQTNLRCSSNVKIESNEGRQLRRKSAHDAGELLRLNHKPWPCSSSNVQGLQRTQ